jgi:hypothetical protein
MDFSLTNENLFTKLNEHSFSSPFYSTKEV